MASELWKSQEPLVWTSALQKYKSAVSFKKVPFYELDKWYLVDLPASIRARQTSANMSKDDLIKLVEWKLARGKWRPKLLDYAKQQEDAVVKDVTEVAFKILSGGSIDTLASIKGAISQLTQLKGVGPATASAALAAVCPHAPFMSDEALEALTGKRDYTLPAYMRLVEDLQQKCMELNAVATRNTASTSCGNTEGNLPALPKGGIEHVGNCNMADVGWDGTWTAVWAERALWAAATAPSTPDEVPIEKVLKKRAYSKASVSGHDDRRNRKK